MGNCGELASMIAKLGAIVAGGVGGVLPSHHLAVGSQAIAK